MRLPADVPFTSDNACVAGQVLHAGRIERSRGHAPCRINRYALVYVIAGTVDYADERGVRATLTPGDLILRFPGFEQSYRPTPGCAWSEQFLTFRGPAIELWEQLGLLNRSQPLWRLAPVALWVKRMIDVTRGQQDPTEDECLEQLARLQGLLAAMRREQRLDPNGNGDETWLRRARRAIDAHADRPPDWSAIAAEFGLGYEGFRKRFRRLAGESPGRHHLRGRMQRATWFLVRSHLTHREVAERCGFSDEFHFSKQFKRMMGLPPQEYRRRHAG